MAMSEYWKPIAEEILKKVVPIDCPKRSGVDGIRVDAGGGLGTNSLVVDGQINGNYSNLISLSCYGTSGETCRRCHKIFYAILSGTEDLANIEKILTP